MTMAKFGGPSVRRGEEALPPSSRVEADSPPTMFQIYDAVCVVPPLNPNEFEFLYPPKKAPRRCCKILNSND